MTNSFKDPTILQCCLDSNRQPYIGVDQNCQQNAIFCIQHSSHVNNQGLIHKMMPLHMFKRTVHSKKFIMQEKIQHLLDNFNKFMQSLIEHIQQIKLRKGIQLSMLWLRELASNEDEYELMRQVYRMDFRNLSCHDIHSIYYKIIHNDALYQKQLSEINCYQGISKVLDDLGNNQKAQKLISEKMAQIEGLLDNGKILQKLLPDKKILKPHVKQILLEQSPNQSNFLINYHKAELVRSSSKFMSLFSKYPIIPHTTYHIQLKTKYSNVMIGVCNKSVKQKAVQLDQHYNLNSIVYNCANGYIYRKGMYFSGSKAQVKGMRELVLKMRLTETQIILMTKDRVLMRAKTDKIIDESQQLFLHVLGRTKSDNFEFERDKQVSAANISLLKTIQNYPIQDSENQEQNREYDKINQNENQNYSQRNSYIPNQKPKMNDFTQLKKRGNANQCNKIQQQQFIKSQHPIFSHQNQTSQPQFSQLSQKHKGKGQTSYIGSHDKKPSDSSFSNDYMKMTLLSNKKPNRSKATQSLVEDNPKKNIFEENHHLHRNSKETESMIEIKSPKINIQKPKNQQMASENREINYITQKDRINKIHQKFQQKISPQTDQLKFRFNPICIPQRSQISEDIKSNTMRFGGLSSRQIQEMKMKISGTHNPHEASHVQIDVSQQNSYVNQIDSSIKKNKHNVLKSSLESIRKIKTPPKIAELNKKISDVSSPSSYWIHKQ